MVSRSGSPHFVVCTDLAPGAWPPEARREGLALMGSLRAPAVCDLILIGGTSSSHTNCRVSLSEPLHLIVIIDVFPLLRWCGEPGPGVPQLCLTRLTARCNVKPSSTKHKL